MAFNFVETAGWKKFIAKLYGLGAAVVIVGALFKIQHWPGAGIMLTLGLCTEAIIFFFSAFEPVHEELDWSLVYPELAGLEDPDDVDAAAEQQQLPKNGAALQRFDDLVGGIDAIDPKVFQNLNDSFGKLNTTAAGLKDVSNASAATTDYANNVSTAAASVGTLAETFKKTAQGLQQSADAISNTSSAVAAIDSSSKNYAEQMNGINTNLANLNRTYEQQLKGASDHYKKTQDVFVGMENLLADMKATVQEAHKYREEMATLNKNLSNLNAVYGNMLSAMTIKG